MDYTDKTTAICANCYMGIYRTDEEAAGMSFHAWYHLDTNDKRCDVKPVAIPIQGTLVKPPENSVQ